MQKQHHVGKFVQAGIDIARCPGHAAPHRKPLSLDPRHDHFALHPAFDLPHGKPAPGGQGRMSRQRMGSEKPLKPGQGTQECGSLAFGHQGPDLANTRWVDRLPNQFRTPRSAGA
ncbi:MAG: hypothetical protein ACTSSQ_00765 [Alphaproteobacteria bacterium]